MKISFILWYLIEHGSNFTCNIIALISDFVKFRVVVACRQTETVTVCVIVCAIYIHEGMRISP